MSDNKINWKRSDYIKLGKAVKDFNRKIEALKNEENQLYLPEFKQYKEIKNSIFTRKEYNRILTSLKKFNEEGSEELYKTEAGEELTKWEKEELYNQKNIIERRLKKELKELNKPLENGYSRAQMGSERVNEIQAQLKNLKSFEKKTGYGFKMLKASIKRSGVFDFKMKQAEQYRLNYYTALEGAKNFQNYELLKNKLDRISNPLKFFEYVQSSGVLSDLFVWYDDSSGTLMYGGFVSNEDAFNYGLKELGILN